MTSSPKGSTRANAQAAPTGFLQDLRVQLILILLALFTLGAFFSLMITPELLEVEMTAHAMETFNSIGSTKLSASIAKWMPKENLSVHGVVKTATEPDWSVPFWSPIDLEFEDVEDPMVTLCKINFREYSKTPHLYPMFREVESMSNCRGANRKKEKMSVLMAELKAAEGTPAGRVVKPNGFVFHESRVGSTLVANTLASDPFAMVYSESPPPAAAFLHIGDHVKHSEHVRIFRNIITLMGRSPVHNHLFFKFQSITSTKMEIALEAFPDVPFAFVYRDSEQTMMSHMDPRKGSVNSPCLRSQRGKTPDLVKKAMELGGITGSGIKKAPKEAWCAAHLSMLCQSALNAYDKYGVIHNDAGHLRQRGILINYESLPGIVGRALLPLFGAEPNEQWLHKMDEESKVYSKGKGQTKAFKSDSLDKESHATDAIKMYAENILDKFYVRMATIGLDSLQAISLEAYNQLSDSSGKRLEDVRDVNWKALKVVPEHASLPHVQRQAQEDKLAADQAVLQAISDAKFHAAQVKDKADIAKNEGMAFSDSIATKEKSNSNQLQLNLRGAKVSSDTIAEHSHSLQERDFIPWSPWSNTHHSKSFAPMGRKECGPLKKNPNYPQMFSLVDILNNWNPDNTEIPDVHYDTLCHFDYSDEEQLKLAFEYRDAEVPFVAFNIPSVEDTVKKWSDIDYLHKKMKGKKYRTETNKDNHFMYWNNGPKNNKARKKGLTDWKAPTEIEKHTFEDFVETAVKGQNQTLEGRTYQYFRVTADKDSVYDPNNWVNEDLPIFSPDKPSLFMKEPEGKRGVHCRFGMRAITAETHYDGSRNSIVQLGGLRRWIMFHPNQCGNLYLLPEDHPSGRHTQIDLSGDVEENLKKFPDMHKLVAHEVIMQPGDMLFVPTHWFHHIVSLNLNYQCNCRSGRDYVPYNKFIKECGFNA